MNWDRRRLQREVVVAGGMGKNAGLSLMIASGASRLIYGRRNRGAKFQKPTKVLNKRGLGVSGSRKINHRMRPAPRSKIKSCRQTLRVRAEENRHAGGSIASDRESLVEQREQGSWMDGEIKTEWRLRVRTGGMGRTNEGGQRREWGGGMEGWVGRKRRWDGVGRRRAWKDGGRILNGKLNREIKGEEGARSERAHAGRQRTRTRWHGCHVGWWIERRKKKEGRTQLSKNTVLTIQSPNPPPDSRCRRPRRWLARSAGRELSGSTITWPEGGRGGGLTLRGLGLGP
ncbi:hypothetical protein C8R44DRAFT_754024 [Mycena epipterygia]|nr:hypothetical protein C8R44DRAFT_754024 [Mycena epipterygia]